jgi:large subunit ribosomal protein L32e
MAGSRTRFKRQESWRLKRVKENWRRPRGVTSRMRKEKKGWPALVKAGRGSAASTRGRHPKGLIERLVRNEADLEGLNPKVHIVRLSGRLGERRRIVLVERAKSLNIHIANPGKEETRPVGEEVKEKETPAIGESPVPETGKSAEVEVQHELESEPGVSTTSQAKETTDEEDAES